MGPSNRMKFAGLQKRDVLLQTSDNEDVEENTFEFELSAMERDIMLCTGCIPDKIRKATKGQRIEGKDLSLLMSLIKLEGSKVIGVNQSLQFKQ